MVQSKTKAGKKARARSAAAKPGFSYAASQVRPARFGPKQTRVRGHVAAPIDHTATTEAHSIVLGKAKKGKTINAWQYHQAQQVLLTGTGSGQQMVQDVAYLLTPSQIITSAGAGYGLTENYRALIAQNINQNNTGGQVIAGGLVPYTDRFLVRKIGLSFEFTNPTTLPAYYKLYAVVLKKECLDAAPAITNWTQGLLQMGATTGQTPVVLSSTGAVGGESAYMVGSLPQWSRQFRDYCKIVKEVSFELPAGSTKKMDFNIHANKIIKHELVAKVAPVAYALGNITMEFFIVGHGALTIHTGGTHDYDVQYGIPKLLVATQTVYHCAQLTGQKNVVLSLLAANRMETTNIIGNLQQINNVDVPDVEKTVA